MDLEDDLKFDTRPVGKKVRFQPNDKLLPKARIACEYYLKGMSVKQAMLKAGYSESYTADSTHQVLFLKNRLVQTYLRQRQEEIAEAESIDKSKLIKYAQHILNDDDAKDRSKALELLMRMTSPTEHTITKEDTKPITLNINVAEKPKED